MGSLPEALNCMEAARESLKKAENFLGCGGAEAQLAANITKALHMRHQSSTAYWQLAPLVPPCRQDAYNLKSDSDSKAAPQGFELARGFELAMVSNT